MKTLKLLLAVAIVAAGVVSATSCKKGGKEEEKILVTDVELNEIMVTLEVGETFELKAVVSPSNATDPSIKWSSENEEVATVKGGTVTAVSEGEATIVAAATDGSGWEVLCYVTVKEATPPEPEKSITVGEQQGLMFAGVEGTVTYEVTLKGFEPNHYLLRVDGLPDGVIEYPDEVFLGDDLAMTLTLEGRGTQSAGTYDGLTLYMDGVTSAPFTLVIEDSSAPTVIITECGVTGIAPMDIWMVADITSTDGLSIIERGMQTEETYGSVLYTAWYPEEGTGSGSFSMNVEYGLQGEKLRFRAYATNEEGFTGYSEWITAYP